jgi:hypothetical protein
MKVKVTRGTGKVFEVFLYAAMILETGLAAFIYKVSPKETDFFHLRVYLAILYFAFLAWGIVQLNRLHQFRRTLASEAEPEPKPAPSSPVVAQAAPQDDTTPEPLGQQVEAVPLVFGLSGVQIMVVLLVFVTALMAFSWVLARMPVRP